jgi:hypothetical protein
MRIAATKVLQPTSSKKQGTMTPPIPLSRSESSAAKPEDILKFKLLSTPTDNDGPTYEVKVKIFRTGTPEDFIKTVIALKKVLRGQNITTDQAQYAMACRLSLVLTSGHGSLAILKRPGLVWIVLFNCGLVCKSQGFCGIRRSTVYAT